LLASFMLFITLFPTAINVLLNSSRGQEALSHYYLIQDIFWGLLSGLGVQAREYLTRLWHLSKHYWFLLYIVLAVTLIYKYLRTKTDRLIDWLLGLILALWSYFAFTMPDMGKFQVRYSMLVYPLAALVTVWYLVFLITPLIRQPKEKWTKYVIGILIFINTWAIGSFAEFSVFAQHYDAIFTEKDVADKRVIVQGDIFAQFTTSDLAIYAKEVYWVPMEPNWGKFSEALTTTDLLLRRYTSQTLREQMIILPQQKKKCLTVQKKLWGIRSFYHGNGKYEEYLITDTPGYPLGKNIQKTFMLD